MGWCWRVPDHNRCLSLSLPFTQSGDPSHKQVVTAVISKGLGKEAILGEPL